MEKVKIAKDEAVPQLKEDGTNYELWRSSYLAYYCCQMEVVMATAHDPSVKPQKIATEEEKMTTTTVRTTMTITKKMMTKMRTMMTKMPMTMTTMTMTTMTTMTMITLMMLATLIMMETLKILMTKTRSTRRTSISMTNGPTLLENRRKFSMNHSTTSCFCLLEEIRYRSTPTRYTGPISLSPSLVSE